CVRDQSGFDFW
nr:immunoglobulin heavy chain junction region [Macaca mulatta]